MSSTIQRVALGTMSLFFVAAAYVQLNDPDPHLWIPVYLVPAAICAWQALQHVLGLWPLSASVIHLAMLMAAGVLAQTAPKALATLSSSGWSLQTMEVEEVRESSGLVVILLFLLINLFMLHDGCKSAKQTGGPGLATAALVALPVALAVAWGLWAKALGSGMVHVAEHCEGLGPEIA